MPEARTNTAFVIALYMGAIVAANMLVASYGKIALYLTAFLIIPFDLFSRDILHEAWRSKGLFLKMALLIFSGSTLTWLLNREAELVAIGSFTAFLCAGTVNTLVYQAMYEQPKPVKMNASNLLAALADSFVFVAVVFGIDKTTILTQTAIKFLGGAMWVFLYMKHYKKTL